MRTGYHYTDARSLPSIMERGVVPYPLREERHPGVHEIVGRTTGIFVYLRPQTGRDHFGMAAANGLRKQTTHVVVLEVEFPDADVAKTDRPLVHDGQLDGIVLPRFRALRDRDKDDYARAYSSVRSRTDEGGAGVVVWG